MSNNVRIIPLGGIGEVGKNITVVEYRDQMILIDCGLTFPRDDEGVFGVDIVLPDFSYIEDNIDKLKAVVLTHGHEDHIGALPYLMKQVDIPAVYGTRFTLALCKSRADEHGLVTATEWMEVDPDEGLLKVGDFELEFVRVAHSIPDCVAIAVHTPHGTILHSGDIKLDSSPIDGVQTDLGHFAELGSEGVALYLGDSTNADIPGHNKSEMSLASPLRDIVMRAPGRVVFTCFSSHIHRIQQLIDIAHEQNRVVCILGRSMMRNTNIARNLGYMDAKGVTLVKPQRLEDYDDSQVMVICTGSQGEPLAAMNRIAWGSHPTVVARSTDTFVFSSRTIPGNETRVHRIINQLSRLGTHIFHQDNAHVHVSGHGSSDELKTLMQLVRPVTFMPVHGEWRHLRAHSDLARIVGVDENNIIIAENGSVIELSNEKAELTHETVQCGQRLVDRHNNEDIVEAIMADRQQASGDGLLVVVARIDHPNGTGRLELISRGFIDDDQELMDAARTAAEDSIQDLEGTHFEADLLQGLLKTAVEGVVFDKTRRQPLIVPVVLHD